MSKVLKFGGTSVGSAQNMRRVADIVRREGAIVTVLSAMSGTTDALVKVSALAATTPDSPTIEELIGLLHTKYSTCIKELLCERREEALERMEQSWETIRTAVANYTGYFSERKIIAEGELLTSAIFAMYMQESTGETSYLRAPDFMHTDSQGMVDTARLESYWSEVLSGSGAGSGSGSGSGSEASTHTYFITQGFICSNPQGEIDNLGRGGSDYSAALIGVAIGATEVQIWTDIDGMHNNDPRYVENTYPIRSMSFDEAAELAYFGAKILHPSTILPCKERGIAVLLKNTMNPNAEGTTISDIDNDTRKFHAVAAKDGITVIRIYSDRMLMAYGFLRKVFEVFESHRTSIDMITTAEVSLSITIDNDEHLNEITRELEELGRVEVEHNNSIVCIVGQMEHCEKGRVAQILTGVKQVPLKMISYGASHRSITLLIDTEHKKQTLQLLNEHLF